MNTVKKTGLQERFSTGLVSASVFKNLNGKGQAYMSVSFSKRYKDKNGDWQNTGVLNQQDLTKALVVLAKAYEFCVLNKEGFSSSSFSEVRT